MSRTTELLGTAVAAGAGATVAVVAVGGSPLVVPPAVAAVVFVSVVGRRPRF